MKEIFTGQDIMNSFVEGGNSALRLLIDRFDSADDSFEVAKFLLEEIPKISEDIDVSILEKKLGYDYE